MSFFTALNVEPDENYVDEVDNTREIQIEEALKLYNTALRLHAKGPDSYDETAVAYENLFKCEVFKQPAAIHQSETIPQDEDIDLDHPQFVVDAELSAEGGELAESLSQILYISYKNHGTFIMDRLKHEIKFSKSVDRDVIIPLAKQALEQFIQAISRDESDTELWRKVARIASMLGSKKMQRYCLESAVETDDDPARGEVEPATLEEGFAGVQLKELLEELGDTVALSHPIMGPYNKQKMIPQLLKFIDPYPFLPQAKDLGLGLRWIDLPKTETQPLVVKVNDFSWQGLAEALCIANMAYLGDATGIILDIPIPDDVEMTESPAVDAPAQLEIEVNTQSNESGSSTKETSPSGTEPNVVASLEEGHDDHTEPSAQIQAEHEASSSNRKRSQSAAGIRDTPDDEVGAGAPKRSKRVRNRDTLGAEGLPVDPDTQFKEKLQEFTRADDMMFNFIGGILSKFDFEPIGTIHDLQSAVASMAPLSKVPEDIIVRELHDVFANWNERKAAAFIQGLNADILGATNTGSLAGITAFLEQSKSGSSKPSAKPNFSQTDGLCSFVKKVNNNWWSVQRVIWEFFISILPTYTETLWSDLTKEAIMQLVTTSDPYNIERLGETLHELRVEINFAGEVGYKSLLDQMELLCEMFFELHLDLYSGITNPRSRVDLLTRKIEKERLEKWQSLAYHTAHTRSVDNDDPLFLRWFWAANFYHSNAGNLPRGEVLKLWHWTKKYFLAANNPILELQNNAAIPEASADAADREMSKLKTKDFFLGLFQSDNPDPLPVIQSLECILDPEGVQMEASDGDDVDDADQETADSTLPKIPAHLLEMWKFLQTGNTGLRLFLWQRLREAYQKADYTTKVFSCHLKSIEVIVSDLLSPAFAESSSETRQHTILTWLKTIDDLLVKALTLALNDQNAYEIIDERHIKSTCAALSQLCRILHVTALYDDNVKVGAMQLPQVPQTLLVPFAALLTRLREMQVRCWALLYTLFKDGMSQNPEIFTTRDNDLADYMSVVHYSLGLRRCCKVSNKIFLKMMQVELVRLKHVDHWEDYLGQVLFDLYGIRLGGGVYELQDHGCPPETLDRRTALSISNQVISLANQMSIKDLLKSELRPTIEKMQQIFGAAKQTPQMQHNLRNLNEYTKTSINPIKLYSAMVGKVEMDMLPVISPDSPLAQKGWYFLHGMIALTKFKAQKKVAPGATDDLKIAVSFFRLQIQFTPDMWEAWYRLAQCFDAELEEEVLWSSEKLNNNRAPLVQLQRESIHCFVMALSTAMRCADSSFETASKISEMYHDFGQRMYGSSREPFTMEVFYLDDFMRHFSGSGGMYKGAAHKEMTRLQVWRYAAKLFSKALIEKPDYWHNHYMLGKILWKMYAKDEKDANANEVRPTAQKVIEIFEKAIETVPKPRDSRADPILEPHYKLMSIAHKLVMLGELPHQDAADLLQRQPFALRKGEQTTVLNTVAWNAFILESIRHIRHVDKSNWHHRMIARAAHILCDEENFDVPHASLARGELKDSMFTKTMVLNVWKPEYERYGRHCVYTQRYAHFMIKLLGILEDRISMEALVKRVRKKQADFYKFDEVWRDCCEIYCRLIRQAYSIQPGQEDALKRSTTNDEMRDVNAALSAWVDTSGSSHVALTAMKEAQELSKLNAGQLQKPNPIEELVSDAYCTLYLQVGLVLFRPVAPPTSNPSEAGPVASPNTAPSAPAPAPAPVQGEVRSQGPMSLNNLVSNMDGAMSPPQKAADAAADTAPEAAPKSRPKAISRRDILRCVDALLAKPVEAPRVIANAASRPKVAAEKGQGTLLPLLSAGSASAPGGSSVPHPVNTREEELRAEAAAEAAMLQGDDRGNESSAPGSVHDSADDESDLSEVPESDDGEDEGAP